MGPLPHNFAELGQVDLEPSEAPRLILQSGEGVAGGRANDFPELARPRTGELLLPLRQLREVAEVLRPPCLAMEGKGGGGGGLDLPAVFTGVGGGEGGKEEDEEEEQAHGRSF